MAGLSVHQASSKTALGAELPQHPARRTSSGKSCGLGNNSYSVGTWPPSSDPPGAALIGQPPSCPPSCRWSWCAAASMLVPVPFLLPGVPSLEPSMEPFLSTLLPACCELNCVPRECGLTWKEGLCRCNPVKIKSCWMMVGPQSSGDLLRGKFRRRHTGEGAWEDGGRDWE